LSRFVVITASILSLLLLFFVFFPGLELHSLISRVGTVVEVGCKISDVVPILVQDVERLLVGEHLIVDPAAVADFVQEVFLLHRHARSFRLVGGPCHGLSPLGG